MKTVFEELCEWKPGIPAKEHRAFIEQGDFLERAEWYAATQLFQNSNSEFYSGTWMYLWNHVQAEEARLREGDFERLVEEMRKRDLLHKDKAYLDFGCGIGSLGLYLLDNGLVRPDDLFFLDVSDLSLSFLKRRLENRQIWSRDAIAKPKFDGRFGYNWELLNSSNLHPVDVVVNFAVFEHLEDYLLRSCLVDIKNHLKDDGCMVTVHYHETFDGRWPMHHLMNDHRKKSFENFAKSRRLEDISWKLVEGLE